MTDISAWAAIDDNNNTPSPAGWPEAMMPSGVNNSARANMGALKRWRDQAQPTVTATGTGNAQTITYPVAPAALVAGDVFAFYALANIGPATLVVNAQAAKAITTSAGAALIGGEVPAGALITVAYDGTKFRLTGPPSTVPVSSGGTGATTPAGATAALGAVSKTGDTMTGALTVPSITCTAGAAVTGNLSVTGQVSTAGIQYPAMGLSAPATNIGFGYSYTNGSLWVQANGGSVGYLLVNPSDERLKRDIRPVTVDPLKSLCRVELKAFNQLSTRNDPVDGHRSRDVGFIAQQLQKIIPDAVIEPPTEDAFLGLDLMPLVAYCVGAIQQLSHRVEQLEAALVK